MHPERFPGFVIRRCFLERLLPVKLTFKFTIRVLSEVTLQSALNFFLPDNLFPVFREKPVFRGAGVNPVKFR